MPTIFTRMSRDYEAKIKPAKTMQNEHFTLPPAEENDFAFRFQWNIDQHKKKPETRMRNQKRSRRKFTLWNPQQIFTKWWSKREQSPLTTCDEASLKQRVQQT